VKVVEEMSDSSSDTEILSTLIESDFESVDGTNDDEEFANDPSNGGIVKRRISAVPQETPQKISNPQSDDSQRRSLIRSLLLQSYFSYLLLCIPSLMAGSPASIVSYLVVRICFGWLVVRFLTKVTFKDPFVNPP
jgi:hypothetical protein